VKIEEQKKFILTFSSDEMGALMEALAPISWYKIKVDAFVYDIISDIYCRIGNLDESLIPKR